MLPRVELSNVAPATPVQASVPAAGIGDARQEAFQRSLQTLLGKTVQGEVLSRLSDGSFMVKVAGASARMMLPAGVKVGAQVPMTLLTVDPRPTFQVGGGGGADTAPKLAYTLEEAETLAGQNIDAASARPTSLAAALLGRAPLTPASQLPGFDPGAPATTLSNAARVITAVLATAHSAPAPAAAIAGTAPLLASPTVAPAQLAQQLRAALGASGLFYESHVAEWAEGKRSLPELMLEPQAAAGAGKGPAGIDLASAQLINLQLQTHEQARVEWRGEAWPGQAMQWEIHKDAPGQGQAPGQDGDAAQAAWRSGVRFQFPLLGAVSATLVLSGGQVHIRMDAGTQHSAAVLRSHAPALEQSLGAAGSPLASLSISAAEAGNDAR